MYGRKLSYPEGTLCEDSVAIVQTCQKEGLDKSRGGFV